LIPVSVVNQIQQNKNGKRLKTPPKWLDPRNAERKYKVLLRKLARALRRKIKDDLVPRIPELVEIVKSRTPNDRKDQFLDLLDRIIESIREQMQPIEEETIRQMEEIGQQINNFNNSQFQKINRSVFGIDIFVDQPFLRDQLAIFSRQNAQLIDNITEQELLNVSGVVERGLVEGRTFSDIAQELTKRVGITQRRATFIARDQTQRLNANLTRLRQESIGVEEYVWVTAGDERVRPTHRANNGKTFRWDSPPPVTGHPGNDPNCRCISRPVLEGII
jgi:SPP1 gp7 family putative phage head morphogenesis protein